MMNECMVYCIVIYLFYLYLWGEDYNIFLWNNCVVGVIYYVFFYDLIVLVIFKYNVCIWKLILNFFLFLFVWEFNKEKDEFGKK